ncbi:TetR/AcrR family transcriptional regulator [Acinetobacter baumannii]|nr:TetR/AcrR family transcriptional regulator [Acinetobacter baumannii]EKW0132804.1 TetR/AcrR family transcriptional regulator [Acinetobacter baumannii]EKW7279690.1 TetR/AcrR family transcriptional regulator [Acinetobacter baumannii]ELB0699865.1 TetR/AcrR family transcriptional regulator [Acinetobacter baumannii]ELB0703450.1 TetR/AcrR family transcriptional regulator [Acinetobacter baumannii]
MDRQAQFRAREALIFQVAEQLLLENGEAGMTLDVLAAELDLAKGTLYKHFQSKDELYMLLIIRNERMLLEMVQDTEKAFPEHLAFFMLHHLHHLFNELYQVRKQRLRIIIRMTDHYLESIQSHMTTRDYLASIWSLTHGAAAILNSSFYQRYLGSRDTLRVAYIDQALALPKQAVEQYA